MSPRFPTCAWLVGALVLPPLLPPPPAVQAGLLGTQTPRLIAQTSPGGSPQVPAQVLQWRQQIQSLAEQARYAEAIPLQIQELAWVERVFGDGHPSTATSLNNLAFLHSSQGAYAKSESLFLRALAIEEKVLGLDHPDTATSLSNLAELYRIQGAYAKAELRSLRALAINEKVLGPDHPTTALSLNNLAGLYDSQGAYAKAEPLFLRALVIREKVLGPDHPDTAQSLNNLAALYDSQGAYAKAESLYLRALVIREKVLGPDHPSTATSLNNLAFLHSSQGAYAKSESLFLRALAIREKVLGPDHPDTAQSLNNLAALYENQGAYAKAEPLFLRALAIKEKALEPEHPDTATSLNNLAALYDSQGAYAKVETLYRRALAIREKALGPEHPATATSLNNLAELYRSQGAYAKAEPLLLRSLAIRENALGPEHPATATSLNNLAGLYSDKGDYAKAEPLYLRALAISEKALRPDHPTIAVSLNNLAFLYVRLGAYAKAEPLLRRGIALQSRFLQVQLPLLPQSARLAQIQALDAAWEGAFTGADRSQSAAELALFSRLNRYGLLLEIEQRQALLSRAPGPTRQLAQEIAALTSQLADVRLSAPQRQALATRRDGLEQELYRQLPALQPQIVEPSQLAKALPVEAVLVEFQRYRTFDGRQKPEQRWGPPRYLALVLTREGTPRAIDLGPAAPLDALIARALEASQAPASQRPSGSDPTQLWRQVGSQMFTPALLQLLGNAQEWILAPDGELSRVPYAVLPSPRDPQRLLADAVALRLITSGRSLVPQPAPPSPPAASRPLVLADPDYGPAPQGTTAWRPLPASRKEGEVIHEFLNATYYQQAEATTGRLTAARGPRVLHVASHGYYAGAPSQPLPVLAVPLAADGWSRSAFAGLPAARDDAMLNSAIVLAGANRHLRPEAKSPGPSALPAPGRDDDGYLTAKEAAQLQLAGTELVVLSACDTAAGSRQSGEGLYGLQRALNVAGARTSLVSLWKVDDEATAGFMQRYYRQLKQGKGRREALLAVQQEFRTKPPLAEWSDIRFWGAWQLVGDPGPLLGL
jgi:CHAT domain-containing protein/Tfp pilus assembly protein PilF